MQPTKYMGLGTENRVSLYVEPGKFTDRGMEFFVFNGGWRGRLHNGYITCISGNQSWIPNTQTGDTRVLFHGVIPHPHNKNSIAVIDYMDRYLSRSKWIRWFTSVTSHIQAHASILKHRVTAVLIAMRHGWCNPNKYKHVRRTTYCVVDDDIPF